MVRRVVGLLLLLAVGACAREPTVPGVDAAERAGPAAIAAQLPGYVNTPAGWYHSSCVHPVPNGALVDARTGVVTRRDGTTFSTPKCQYPASRKSQSQGGGNDNYPWFQWLEYAYDSLPETNWVTGMSGWWSVPAAPTSTYNSQQTYYAWLGVQEYPDTGNPHLLQPVLQFGYSPHWGGQYWTAASWFCGDQCYHSTQHLMVYPGDVMWGSIGSNNCVGDTCDWGVITRDMTPGHEGQVSLSVLGEHVRYQYPAVVVEVHNLNSPCGLYPVTGVFFHDIEITDRYGTYTPTWNRKINNITPWCSWDVTFTTNTVNLYHNPISLSNAILNDSTYWYSPHPTGGYPPSVGSYWEWCGIHCDGGGGDPTPSAASGGRIRPNTIVHGWQFLSTAFPVYWTESQRWLRNTVTDSHDQQAVATYWVP